MAEDHIRGVGEATQRNVLVVAGSSGWTAHGPVTSTEAGNHISNFAFGLLAHPLLTFLLPHLTTTATSSSALMGGCRAARHPPPSYLTRTLWGATM
jgi:hypothetical protein